MVKEPILVIDKPRFIVRLHEDLLEVDLKKGARKELEDVIEGHAALRKSLGFLLQTVIPSDVALSEMDFVEVDETGQLKIVVPLHRDIVLPLSLDESRLLSEKLNELIPLAKTRKAARRRRLPLHMWWPDYYAQVFVSGH
jgi:hypothetical protein